MYDYVNMYLFKNYCQTIVLFSTEFTIKTYQIPSKMYAKRFCNTNWKCANMINYILYITRINLIRNANKRLQFSILIIEHLVSDLADSLAGKINKFTTRRKPDFQHNRIKVGLMDSFQNIAVAVHFWQMHTYAFLCVIILHVLLVK